MGKKTHGPYLIAAIEYNDINKVSEILSTKFRDKQNVKNFLVSEVRRLASEYTAVPLLLAATLDDPTILRYFVQKHEANINFVYEYGYQKPRKRKTALLAAVRQPLRKGGYVMVDAILSMNGDVNIQDHKGRTPLHHAVKRADYSLAKLLVARGAQTGLVDIAGNSPLHLATIFGHGELVRLMLRHGGDPYKTGQCGAIPIHMAAKEGHAALVRMFCDVYEVSPDIRVPCYDGREMAPLHVAAMEGHAETVMTLLEYCGADVNLRDSDGETALHNAVIHEYDPLGMKAKDDFTETVKVLLNYGAEVNIRNARGETALHLAARNEFQKIIEVLVIAGCDPMTEDNDKNRAIVLVADDDMVSKQTLKNAMANREKLMNEAMEIRSKGFTTSLQRALPFSSNRSQSTMNIPLAGMSSGTPRFNSSTGLFQPNQSAASYAAMMPAPSSGINRSHESHGTSSSSDSKRRSKDSKESLNNIGGRGGAGGAGAGGAAKLPPSMIETYQLPPKPLPAVRKAKSVEELDQVGGSSGGMRGGIPGKRGNPYGHAVGGKNAVGGSQPSVRVARGRNASLQGSEGSLVSSLWDVTPPGSMNELDKKLADVRNKQAKMPPGRRAQVDSDEDDDAFGKMGRKYGAQRNDDSEGEEDISEKAPSEDYFLDDEDSVDPLEDYYSRSKKPLPALPSGNGKGGKGPPPVKSGKPTETNGGSARDLNKAGLQSWLDEQARLLKEKERTNPSARSTPLDTSRGLQQNKNMKNDDVSSSSVSSDSQDESAGPAARRQLSSAAAAAGAGRKPKPPPPPKPSKERAGSLTSLPGRYEQYTKDNPHIDKVIELEVYDRTDPGQTSIRVVPVHPPGPTKIQTFPAGASTSTFVRLPSSSDQNGSLGRNSGGKTTPVADKKSTLGRDAKPVPVPVPKPRDTKTSTSGPSSGNKSGTMKSKGRTDSDASSGSFSDVSDDVDVKKLPPAKKGVPVTAASKVHPPAAVQPIKTIPPKETGKASPSTAGPVGAGPIVFEKANVAPSGDAFQRLHPMRKSLGDLTGSNKKNSEAAMLSQSFQLEPGSAGVGGTKPFGSPLATGPTTNKSGSQPKQPLKTQQSDVVLPRSRAAESSSSEENSDTEEESDGEATLKRRHVSMATNKDIRSVSYNATSDDLGYMIIGGNVDGIFAFAVDGGSAAARQGGLLAGDQILKINNHRIHGLPRDEAQQALHLQGPITLTVQRAPEQCKAVANRGGAGDSFFVRARYSYDPVNRGELPVREGEVFHITNTVPDRTPGFWSARRMGGGPGPEPRKTSLSGPEEPPILEGLIPNRAKADQIATKQHLASKPGAPAADQRGGALLRSLRRAKSADRSKNIRGGDEDGRGHGVDEESGYERVVQSGEPARKPVVIIGLFCDSVISMLVRESPDQFESPSDAVEVKVGSELGDPPVNVAPICRAMERGKHALIMLSPPSIEYLVQKTDLNPIIIYISPVSKAVVKAVKMKLAPNYNKQAAYMYEEAVKFERNYANLFTATVDYTPDDWWFFHLKEAINRIQSQPMWITQTEADIEAAGAAELAKILPEETSTLRRGQGVSSGAAGRQGRDTTPRISRTTDDLPQPNAKQQVPTDRSEDKSDTAAGKSATVAKPVVTPAGKPSRNLFGSLSSQNNSATPAVPINQADLNSPRSIGKQPPAGGTDGGGMTTFSAPGTAPGAKNKTSSTTNLASSRPVPYHTSVNVHSRETPL